MLVLDSSALARLKKQRETETSFERGRARSEERVAKDKHLTDPDADRDRLSADQSMGHGMYGTQLVKRLKRLNPTLQFERSKALPHLYNTYIHDGVNNLDSADPFYKGVRCIGIGFAAGWMPEWSLIAYRDEEAKQRPYEKDRGWRTVLVKLLKAGFLTEPQIFKEFGEPAQGSQLWYEQTR